MALIGRNKCLLCTSKCSRCKAVPDKQVAAWESDGWTYLGKLGDGYSLIAYQHGCTERSEYVVCRS